LAPKGNNPLHPTGIGGQRKGLQYCYQQDYLVIVEGLTFSHELPYKREMKDPIIVKAIRYVKRSSSKSQNGALPLLSFTFFPIAISPFILLFAFTYIVGLYGHWVT
jgi:hypothetical protein